MNVIKNNKFYFLAIILSLSLIIILLTSIFWQVKHTSKIIEEDANVSNVEFEVRVRNDQGCIEPGLVIDPCELRCIPTEEELKMARIAWKYIENNFDEKTGLTAAAHKYPSAATWDWANAVFAIFAARKFEIIDQVRFEEMMKKFLKTMQNMKLFNNELPNKTYNTISAKMTNYGNQVKKDGIGWSASDIARLLSALNLIEQCEEPLAPEVEKLTLRYRYCRALSVEGDLYGSSYHEDTGKLAIHHEALTGYEEFHARSYELWGHSATEARKYKFLKEVEIYGIKIPTDTRTGFSNFIESEPFWYLGFEYGIDDNESGRFVKNMYKVQEERYNRTGQITAVTEDNIDQSPYFLFNTVYTHGEAWKTINQMGADYDEFKTVSTKAGIGMHYLFDTAYSNKVYHYLKNNYNPKRGYYAGIYEKRPGANRAMTLNTNAIILEGMLSSKLGPLQKIKPIESRGIYDHYRNTINNFRCLPTEEEMKIVEPFDPSMNHDHNESDKNCGCKGTELETAKIAWSFFENNYQEKTGLVNGINNYHIIRPEHIGRTIMATISAESMDIIYKDVFNKRMSKLLKTLKKMKKYNGELPNLYYNAKNGDMVDKAGKKVEMGRGWDLYSIAQMMTGLYYLQRDYPEYRNDVYEVVAGFHFKRAIEDKFMQNRFFDGAKGGFTELKDPAKEFYVHNALKLFNIKSYSNFVDERYLDYKAVYDYEVPMGYNDRVTNGESYLWTMIEHPYYLKYKHYSSNIYLALKQRYMLTEKLATSTEESLDRKPYWIQNTIYNQGKLWDNLDRNGKPQKYRDMLSTKASFIYNALYGYTDDYASVLMNSVKELGEQGKGWYAGRYVKINKDNKSLDLHTNAAVLQALYYKKVGNLYYAKNRKLYDKVAFHEIDEDNKFYIETSKTYDERWKAHKLLKSLDDHETGIPIRVVRDPNSDNFLVRIGAFETEEEALTYIDNLKIKLPRTIIKQGDVDSEDFMLATRPYNYSYHIPYKNVIMGKEENKSFKSFMKRFLKKKKLANKKKE